MTAQLLAAPLEELGAMEKFHFPTTLLGDCDSPGLYMLQNIGDCCRPDISDGDLVLVSPEAEPRAGDWIAIWMKSGHRALERLMFTLPPLGWAARHEDDVVPKVIFEQTNPPKQLFVPIDRVRAVHKVVGAMTVSDTPGWHDDGLYAFDFDGDWCVDRIKVRTKKGTIRKVPRGEGLRYNTKDGLRVRAIDLRLFGQSAGEAPS